MAQDVQVYDVAGKYQTDLGKTVLPAAVKAVDFSALDNALKTEEQLANKALDTITANLKGIGQIQDDLTQIPLFNPAHHKALDEAKKEVGIDSDQFKSALGNMDNPTALYDLDRKMKKLMVNPVVKNIMYENAITDNFKANLPTIEDPNLRAKAVADLAAAAEDETGQAIKGLNLSMYQTLDLPSSYKAVIDQYAPVKTTAVRKVGPNNESYTEMVTGRDPDAVKKAREYYMKNKKVENNLKAQGIMDENGEMILDGDGKNWFDIIEAGELQQSTEISDVKGTSPESKASGVVDYSITGDIGTPGGYTQNMIEGFDLGLLGAVETAGRSVSVHADPVKDPIVNFGAYSFNRTVAKDFLESLRPDPTVKDKTGKNKEIAATIDEILGSESHFTDTSKENLEKVNKLYKKLESLMPGGKLAQSETDYVVNNFAKDVTNYASNAGVPFTEGGKTFLMDSAVQFGPDAVKKWIDDYADDNKGAASLEEYVYKKRLDWAHSTGKLTEKNRPAVINRIKQVYAMTMLGNTTSDVATGTKVEPSDYDSIEF